MIANTSKFIASIMAMGLFLATGAFAAGPPGIRYTTHNMSSAQQTSNYKAANEDEVCIFCHTPHGGSLTGPLWNRPTAADGSAASGALNGNVDYSGDYFTHYNSATLTAAARGKNRPVNAESLLCMTCHDGTIAVNRVLNVSNRTAPDPLYPDTRIAAASGDWVPMVSISADWPPPPGPIIGSTLQKMADGDLAGGDLSDDHPISFSYTAVQTDPTEGLSLRAIGLAQARGVRFFGGDRVECSTCHDPHVDYGDAGMGSPNSGDANYTKYDPFLITSNEASALCLACHIK